MWRPFGLEMCHNIEIFFLEITIREPLWAFWGLGWPELGCFGTGSGSQSIGRNLSKEWWRIKKWVVPMRSKPELRIFNVSSSHCLSLSVTLVLEKWAECYNNPLTPSPATIMAGTFLAITRQPIELERCSNPPRIREVFLFRLNKKFVFGFSVLWAKHHKWGVCVFFGQLYLALGANPMIHFLAQVFFWKLGYHASL